VDRYKVANETERNRIRERLDGYQRLQHLSSALAAPVTEASGMSSSRFQASSHVLKTSAVLPSARSALRRSNSESAIEEPKLDDVGQRRREVDDNRARWESTLPKPTSNQPGHIRTGYTYEYIEQGESSKSKSVDFRQKPKKKVTIPKLSAFDTI
jgi:hypothetical protein